MDYEIAQLALIAVAMWVGETFGSMFGGGSFFIQPALLAANIPAPVAVANDVAAASFASLSFLWFFRHTAKQENLNLQDFKRAIVWMSIPLVFGAVIGGHVLNTLSVSMVQGMILVICTAGFIYTVYRFWSVEGNSTLARKPFHEYWKPLAILAGSGIGFYDGVSGAGSGIIIIFAVSAIFRLNIKATLALANAISVISLASAGITYLYLGLLSFELLTVMIPAALIAGATAAYIAKLIPERVLKGLYLCLMLVLILYLTSKVTGLLP
jgi:uncharacterized protein